MLVIKMFGSVGGETRTCDVVRIAVKTNNGMHLYLQLLVVPLICELLTGQLIICAGERFLHLSGLELADNSMSGDTLVIYVLVGSDYYWEFVTRRVVHKRSGPTDTKTRLGWVLSGPVPGYSDEHSTVNLFSSHILPVETYPAQNTWMKG